MDSSIICENMNGMEMGEASEVVNEKEMGEVEKEEKCEVKQLSTGQLVIPINYNSSVFYLPVKARENEDVEFRASNEVVIIIGKNSSPDITGKTYAQTVSNMFLYLSSMGIDCRYTRETHYISNVAFEVSCKIQLAPVITLEESEESCLHIEIPPRSLKVIEFWNKNFEKGDRFAINRSPTKNNYYVDIYFDSPVHEGAIDTSFENLTQDEAFAICYFMAAHDPHTFNYWTISGKNLQPDENECPQVAGESSPLKRKRRD